MSGSAPHRRTSGRGFDSRSLGRAIFDAPSPEEFIRTIPNQSLYLTIRNAGLSSSSDLIEIATVEQCRALIDFDCWNGDSFSEEHFWEWLSLGDDEEGLKILQKIVQSIDLKLVSLLISRYVEARSFDEPTESPPGPQFITPDKGYTWLSIKLEDGRKHFLFGRLLAMIFETNPELFYQLLAAPGVATDSMLEEDSYSERNKRLANEGIPEPDHAAELHQPLPGAGIAQALKDAPETIAHEHLSVIEPLLYDSLVPQPLKSLLEDSRYHDRLEAELSWILNAALVFFKIDLDNPRSIVQLSERIKGAINLGFESAQQISHTSVETCYETLGLPRVYRHALALLFDIRGEAKRTLQKLDPALDEQSPERQLLLGLSSKLPFVPSFFLQQTRDDASHIDLAPSPIAHLADLLKARQALHDLEARPSLGRL